MRCFALFAVFLLLPPAIRCSAQTPGPVSGITYSGKANAPSSPLSLWYRRPAVRWTEALPIGNGRLGAMVFGAPEQEHLQLNEDTLWAGGPYDPVNPHARAALPGVRQLIFKDQYDAAAALIAKDVMAVPLRQMPYQTLGDLFLDFSRPTAVQDYRRELDLDTAIATVTYESGGIHFKREFFSSPVDQVIVMRLTADKPGSISFTARLTTPQNASVTAGGANTLLMSGSNDDFRGIKAALKFQARLAVLVTGGRAGAEGNQIKVANADSSTLLIDAATSYKSYKDVSGNPEEITRSEMTAALAKPYEVLRKAHIAEHQRLFNRVSLDLGRTEAMQLPTDERIANFSKGGDSQLAVLYFQFGRYLLICSSRPGCQPSTLQGIWNGSMTPPWESKYTININTEMNYWPAETTNLSECVLPLAAMVMDLSKTGARTAEEMYGARGWVVHHNTDLWRATAPIDGPGSGMWQMGGAWLCQNLWEHYLFTEDKDYLRSIYPAMKGAAQFFLDTLVEEPTHHWLVTCPSLSPENPQPNAHSTSITAGPTMDMEILRDLFSNCIQAEEILGMDKDFGTKLAATRARLAPLQIGAAGQLQEWLQDIDMKSRDLHHRHVSHLYALYPSDQINLNTTPVLAAAAKKSLEIRGDKATGWGTAWRACLWARLHDGDHAYRVLNNLLNPSRTYPDLLDSCPPFQIDGNFGGTAAMAEMLLQSQNGEIQLLPALPQAWSAGSVRGLRARGGFEVDMKWKDEKLTSVAIHSASGDHCRISYGEVIRDLTIPKGSVSQLDGKLEDSTASE